MNRVKLYGEKSLKVYGIFFRFFMLRVMHQVLRLINPVYVQVQSSTLTIDRCRKLLEGLVSVISSNASETEAVILPQILVWRFHVLQDQQRGEVDF